MRATIRTGNKVKREFHKEKAAVYAVEDGNQLDSSGKTGRTLAAYV